DAVPRGVSHLERVLQNGSDEVRNGDAEVLGEALELGLEHGGDARVKHAFFLVIAYGLVLFWTFVLPHSLPPFCHAVIHMSHVVIRQGSTRVVVVFSPRVSVNFERSPFRRATSPCGSSSSRTMNRSGRRYR